MTLSLDRQNEYRRQYRSLRAGWHPATEVYETLIRQRLQPSTRLLDFGCGRGGVLEQLGESVHFPIAFDPDLESLRHHRMPDLLRAQSLADKLPLPDSSFDLVICSWVLEHVAAPLQVFSEVARVLRPGGAFVFLTPNSRSLIVWMNRILSPLQRILVPRLYGRTEADTFPVQYQANTRDRIAWLADRAGLYCDRLQLVEDPTYLAFNGLMFRASRLLSQITPPVHLVGVLTKPGG